MFAAHISRRQSRAMTAMAAALAAAVYAWARLVAGLVGRLRHSLVPRALALVLGSFSSMASGWVKNQLELMRWKSRVFLHRLQVVLLCVAVDEEGNVANERVEKRTLFEGNLVDTVMNGNHAAAALCLKAASRCTDEKPFITQHLPSDERYQVLNNSLNLVSSLCPAGHIAQDIDPDSTLSCWYSFGMMTDVQGSQGSRGERKEMANTKIRIVLVKESLLNWLSRQPESFLKAQDQRFQNGSAWHDARWRTLRKMAKVLEDQRLFRNRSTQPASKSGRTKHVLRVSLSAPVSYARPSQSDVYRTPQQFLRRNSSISSVGSPKTNFIFPSSSSNMPDRMLSSSLSSLSMSSDLGRRSFSGEFGDIQQSVTSDPVIDEASEISDPL